MKTGQDSVKAALRAFFDNAAEDLEKTMENLRQGQFTHTRTQPRGVTQIINYTTIALLPVLSSLFEHIAQNLFGEDLIRESPSFCIVSDSCALDINISSHISSEQQRVSELMFSLSLQWMMSRFLAIGF